MRSDYILYKLISKHICVTWTRVQKLQRTSGFAKWPNWRRGTWETGRQDCRQGCGYGRNKQPLAWFCSDPELLTSDRRAQCLVGFCLFLVWGLRNGFIFTRYTQTCLQLWTIMFYIWSEWWWTQIDKQNGLIIWCHNCQTQQLNKQHFNRRWHPKLCRWFSNQYMWLGFP